MSTPDELRKQMESKANAIAYDNYYSQYSALASKYGISPMDRATFNTKMDATAEKQGGFIGQILVPLKDQIQTSINNSGKALSTKAQENGQSIPYNPVSMDLSKWRGSTADDIIGQIDSKFADPYEKVNYDITTIKPAETYTPSDLMKQYETNLKAEADAPDAVRPEYNYSGENTAKYFDTISAAEQAGTNKAVGAVNETANFVNPYATGSGSQIKAVAGMLDNITANQQARAFALGENSYAKNYAGTYADYEKLQAKKTTAQSGIFNLAKFYEDSANAKDKTAYDNAWNTYTAGQGLALQSANQAADDRRYNRETELLSKASELNSQTNTNNWWQGFVAPAVGAFTGGLGTAAVSAVTGNTTENYLALMKKYGIIK